ncbi:nasE [Symbiodinium sp. CCMP2592]|nr:nasE [Symbiodinium sp. CCMP2592]
MTVSYTWVQWNKHKKTYDLIMLALSLIFVATFILTSTLVYKDDESISAMILAMRAFGILAIILLHIILCIGPLARITPLMSPILYNRRHLGVMMFFAALIHAGLALLFYGAFGVRSPFAGLFDGYHAYTSISGFPFEIMGLFALLILFVMASTSHDFWLAFLTPRLWKSLHMLVYLAYAFVLLHVVFGALQSERHPALAIALIAGAVTVSALHIVSGLKEIKPSLQAQEADAPWIDIGLVNDFPMDQGRVVCIANQERVAIFRHKDGISALSNVCAHQAGPLGEGRIVNGCVTCPWHGYQYHADNGQSPPPYTERIPTYELRVEGERVLLNPEPNPPGTPVTPAAVPPSTSNNEAGES